MALSLTKPQPPELLGISPEMAAKITAAGGELKLPEASIYLRLGAIAFPRPRTILLQWEVWPSQDAARERKLQPQVAQMMILPEPSVMRAEVQDSSGKVISPALVLPTYDEFMAAELTESPATLADVFDQARTLAYQWAKTWPEFSGATDA